MTDRDVRDLICRAFEGIAERHGVSRSHSHACALELIAALTGHGIRLVRPANLHDPVADWRRDKPEPGEPAGSHVVRTAMRSQINGTGVCPICRTTQIPLTRDGTLSDHEPYDAGEFPLAQTNCVGAGLTPDKATAPTWTPPTTKADTP